MAESLSEDVQKRLKLHEEVSRLQQKFYELSSDWNIYKKANELVHLKNFIGYAFYGLPELDTNSASIVNLNHEYNYEAEQKEVINMICTQILNIEENQLKLDVQCAVIYNVIYGKELGNAEEKKDEHIYPIPIFKVKRHTSVKEQQRIYIDNNGRVYQNWTDYITNNTLPKCTMIYPKDGYYQADPSAEESSEDFTTVWLEMCESPACNLSTVAQAMDVASAAMSVATIGIGVASMFTPVTAGIGIFSLVSGGASSLWSIGRCSQQLADRSEHRQSISVTSKPALGAWLGIAGSAMGVAGSGGTLLLSSAVRNGASVGFVARTAYNTITIGNVFVNGLGIGFQAYNMYEKYQTSGEWSLQDVALLTAHIVFFSNSVLKFSLASDLIKSTQGQFLDDYESSLRSNRHRKEFRKLVKGTEAHTSSEIARNEEIIRSVNQINSKDEFFAGMARNSKIFSKGKVKVSFSNGKVMINGKTLIDPIEFAQLPAETRISTITASSLTQSQTVGSTVTATNQKSLSINDFTVMLRDVVKQNDSPVTMNLSTLNMNHLVELMQEIETIENNDNIVEKMITWAWKIIKRKVRRFVEVIFQELVGFLWNYVKTCLENIHPGLSILDEKFHELIHAVVDIVGHKVEDALDSIYDAFCIFLKNLWALDSNQFHYLTAL